MSYLEEKKGQEKLWNN